MKGYGYGDPPRPPKLAQCDFNPELVQDSLIIPRFGAALARSCSEPQNRKSLPCREMKKQGASEADTCCGCVGDGHGDRCHYDCGAGSRCDCGVRLLRTSWVSSYLSPADCRQTT